MRTGGAARVAHPAHALHAQARQESIAIGVGTLDAHLAEVAAPLALLRVDPARELLLGVLRRRHRDLPELLLRGRVVRRCQAGAAEQQRQQRQRSRFGLSGTRDVVVDSGPRMGDSGSRAMSTSTVSAMAVRLTCAAAYEQLSAALQSLQQRRIGSSAKQKTVSAGCVRSCALNRGHRAEAPPSRAYCGRTDNRSSDVCAAPTCSSGSEHFPLLSVFLAMRRNHRPVASRSASWTAKSAPTRAPAMVARAHPSRHRVYRASGGGYRRLTTACRAEPLGGSTSPSAPPSLRRGRALAPRASGCPAPLLRAGHSVSVVTTL